MKYIDLKYNIPIGMMDALIGGLIGYLLGSPPLISSQWGQLAVLGGIIGFLILPFYR